MAASGSDGGMKDPAEATRHVADKMDDLSDAGMKKAMVGLEMAQQGLESTKQSVGELMDAVNDMIGKVKDSLDSKSRTS